MPLIRSSANVAPEDRRENDADLTSTDPDQRRRAVKVVATDPDGATILAQALAREDDAYVRQSILAALTGLGSRGLRHVVEEIRSEDAARRTAALDMLRDFAATLQLHLSELIGDDDPDVRLLVCEVARGLPSPAATRLMVDLLDRDPEVNVCAAAVEVLAEVGEPEAVGALERCARRFAQVPFLVFATRVAAQRLGATRD